MNFGALAQPDGRSLKLKNTDVLVRTASAAILLAVALGAAYLGGVAAGIVTALFAVLVQFEWGNITGGSIARTAPFAASIAASILLASNGPMAFALLIASLTIVGAAAFGRGVWLPAGVAYAAVLGISLIAIRVAPEYGLDALIFVLAVVWATDSGAFFAGRSIGGPKLWPRISPKKTWSGAVGGLLAAVAVGLLIAQLTGAPVTPALAFVCLILSIFCQLGDLFESWLKRHFGAKDSGNIIPGHGGVMDRVDGLTFAAAAAVVIGASHSGIGHLGRGVLIW